MVGMGGQNGSRRLPQENGSADNHHPEWRSACAARTQSRAEQEGPAPARARSMKRNKRPAKADPLEREIELALKPGAFISDRACFKFAGELDELASRIAELEATDPARTVALYEAFLAGCYEKVGEVDDSSGSFGQTVGQLFCAWTAARQASGADPDETAVRLLRWMDDDDYGFCHRLEKALAPAFDKAGLAAFVKHVRARFDSAGRLGPSGGGPEKGGSPDTIRRRWGEVLRSLYAAQKDIAAYVALCEETGLATRDCHAIAGLFAGRRRYAEALEWVERGISLGAKSPREWSASSDLAHLKRDLLVKMGRGSEALSAAWADYCRSPSKYSYEDLMKFVPKPERGGWHEKAIEAAQTADLHSRMELLFETKESGRLADLVRATEDPALESLSHYTTEPVARKLERPHPDLAGRLWRAQGMRILDAGKSKYYDAALANFERAKRCYERAGLVDAWNETVVRVRAEHRRKIGFTSGFERLLAGTAPRHEPSFLKRAKARWSGC